MKRFLLVFTLFLSAICCVGQTLTAKEQAALKAECKRQYTAFCKEINQQTPMYIDEYTTLNSVVFTSVNMRVTLNYTLNLDFSDVEESDMKEMMKELRENVKQQAVQLFARSKYDMTREQLKWLWRQTGLNTKFLYRDANNDVIGSFVITYKDL